MQKKQTLVGLVKCHSWKLRATVQAAIFDELDERTCCHQAIFALYWKDPQLNITVFRLHLEVLI